MRFPYKGAGVVLVKQEKGKTFVFLGRRAKHPFFDFLAIPGGSFDLGKDRSSFDNATRECLEEIGINIKSEISIQTFSLLGENEIRFPFFSWRSFFVLVNDTSAFNRVVPDEFSDLGWYNTDELIRLKLRPFTTLEIKRCLSLVQILQRPPLA